MPLKVSTWNVNGVRAREAELCAWLDKDRPDVVCLQEIKASPEQLSAQLAGLPGYHACWHGAGGYSGVALLVNERLVKAPLEFIHPPFDVEHRVVGASFGGVTTLSVYLPNGGKDYPAKIDFLRQMTAWIAAERGQDHELLICGDMNIALTDLDVHPKERKPNAIGQRDEERVLFQGFFDAGLCDVGRTLAPADDGLFTWWPYWRNMRQRNIGWRLDYLLASPAIARRIAECTVQREVGTSDHAPVTAIINA